MTVVWTNYRMNDYVGPGIYATVTWAGPCKDGGSHVFGMSCCVRCHMVPKVEYGTTNEEVGS